MHSLKHKVAIITGGACGIGAEIVKEFLKEEAKHVAIIDLNESMGRALEVELRVKYGIEKVQFFNTDITFDDKLSAVFNKVVDKFGAIDVIVNNAGIANDDTFRREIDINFTALVSSSLKGLELMRTDKGGKGGTIINISSLAALDLISPSIFIYAATKSAVLHFSTCMGMEEYYNFTNVRVITICFGATKTKLMGEIKGIDEITTASLKQLTKIYVLQEPLAAAQGVVESYKSGSTGTTWLVDNSKATDVTADVREGYKIMSKHIAR